MRISDWSSDVCSSDLFLAEGLRILTEAAETGRLPRYLVHAADARAHPLVQRLTDATEAAGGEVIETSRDILHKLSGKENPQSVLVFSDRSEDLRLVYVCVSSCISRWSPYLLL